MNYFFRKKYLARSLRITENGGVHQTRQTDISESPTVTTSILSIFLKHCYLYYHFILEAVSLNLLSSLRSSSLKHLTELIKISSVLTAIISQNSFFRTSTEADEQNLWK